MTSEDKYITVEMFNAGVEKLRTEIRAGNDQIRTELLESKTELKAEIRLNAQDTVHLQTSVYWGFAILAVVVALVGFVITLAPMFKGIYKDAKEFRRREDMREVAREVVKDEVKEEVLKVLGKYMQ